MPFVVFPKPFPWIYKTWAVIKNIDCQEHYKIFLRKNCFRTFLPTNIVEDEMF